MNNIINKQIEVNNKLHNDKLVLDFRQEKSHYSLKDQLEQLTGLVDTSKLEDVNIVIGIIISVLLLAYFIA